MTELADTKTKRDEPEARPVFGKPALVIHSDTDRILALADLHIGYEYSLLDKGITLPCHFEKVLSDIVGLLDAVQPSHVVIVGDLKDSLFVPGPGTMRQMSGLFDVLGQLSRTMIVVKGNHDGRIEDFIPHGIGLLGAKGGIVGNVGFFHGHSWPDGEVLEASLVITAHNHQTFGSVIAGKRDFHHPCWIRGRWNAEKVMEHYPDSDRKALEGGEVIVLPSFVQTGKGVVVNRRPEFLGPVLGNGLLDWNRTKVYLLDGTELGFVSDLRDGDS